MTAAEHIAEAERLLREVNRLETAEIEHVAVRGYVRRDPRPWPYVERLTARAHVHALLAQACAASTREQRGEVTTP